MTKTIHSLVRALVISLALCACFSTALQAQDAPGGRATALGGSALVLDDVWSGFHNQAGAVHLPGLSAGAYYESRFALNELSDKGIVVAMPFRKSAFGLNYRSFGYSLFTNSRAGLFYAQKLSDKFSVGLQFNYYSLRLGENYGSRGTVGMEGGFLYRYNTKLSVAAHIQNPTRAGFTDFNNERLPSILRFSAGYRFSDKVMMIAEVKKPDNAGYKVSGGIEYFPATQIAIRGGFNSDQSFSFGFGWKIKTLTIDAAAGFHAVLGFTPHISLNYTPQRD
ncbi:MAG: hypothetical protein ACKVOK_05025 [Flavobacteriales bacterium]